jgi:hypothetical protein
MRRYCYTYQVGFTFAAFIHSNRNNMTGSSTKRKYNGKILQQDIDEA